MGARCLKQSGSRTACAPPTTTVSVHANWHHLMSHTIASKQNYIHLNLSYTSTKEVQKKWSTFSSQLNENRKDKKWDMCKLLCVHFFRRDESSMHKRRGWNSLCLAYLYDTRLWKEKSKQSLLEQNVNFLALPSWPGMVNNHHFSCWFSPSKAALLHYAFTGDHRKVSRHAWWIKADEEKSRAWAADRGERGQNVLACKNLHSYISEYKAIKP